MTPVYIIMGVFLALFLILAMWAMGVFNNLVKLRNRFENAFSQIDVQLKRRHDLIPNHYNFLFGQLHVIDGYFELVSARL